MKIGPHSGESIPATERHGFGGSSLKWGDGTIHLGYYIGVLATEYKLLKLRSQNTNQTIKELYFALCAFNRLDYMADKYWGDAELGPHQGAPNLNGFFIRSDVPSDFLGRMASGVYLEEYTDDYLQETKNNFHDLTSNKVVPSSYKTGVTICPTLNSVERDWTTQQSLNSFCEESQDQVIYMLAGLGLVTRLVDEGETYNELDFPIEDGIEARINQEA